MDYLDMAEELALKIDYSSRLLEVSSPLRTFKSLFQPLTDVQIFYTKANIYNTLGDKEKREEAAFQFKETQRRQTEVRHQLGDDVYFLQMLGL